MLKAEEPLGLLLGSFKKFGFRNAIQLKFVPFKGAFGDISTKLERLIKALAESRALYLSREAGRPLSDREAGLILGQYRRVLSVCFVRSNAACLVARMGHLGESARECAGRRRVAMAEGVRMSQEAAAYHAAHIRGKGCWVARGN